MKRSNRGNMPFAIIAVTLLLLGSAYAIVSAQTERSADNAENISGELGEIDSVITNTECFVERGLGEIIFSLSSASCEGTMEERMNKYVTRANEWMNFQFPILDSGVNVKLRSFETEANIETLKFSETDLTDGCTPSYLVGIGKFTAEYSNDSARTTNETEFETDASCALPLIAEQGSLFKNAISGTGSVISQMINYQLTALAQFRVLNGYGAIGEYGDMGTVNILTGDDVSKAYSNAVKVLGLKYFRTAPDGISAETTDLDLADYYISSNGNIEVNVSAIYSQALMSVADDIALQWFDYFYGNVLVNIADSTSDVLCNAWDSLKGFFTKKNEFSAAPYIEGTLSNNGYDISEYRHLYSGRSFSVNVTSEMISSFLDIDSDGIRLSIDYPSVDLMSWDGISHFKQHYRSENNEIREWFTEIINTAAVNIGAKKAFNTIRFNIDPCDNESFMESVTRNVESSLRDGNATFERIMVNAISGQKVIDPFYASIYDVISENCLEIYGVNGFSDSIRSSVESQIRSMVNDKNSVRLDETGITELTNEIMNSSEIRKTIDSYEDKVESLMEGFSGLTEVANGPDGMIKRICRYIMEKGLVFTTGLSDITGRIISLCNEIKENMEINSFYGLTDLPGCDDFTVVDAEGNVATEKMSFTMESSPTIAVNSPNSNLSDCVHYVGVFQNSDAAYCTVFSISIKDTLRFTSTGSGTLEDTMGIHDSAVEDSCNIDIKMKIAVASAWKLQGVKEYTASNTALSDAWTVLLELLEPLLEPLKKILSMITDALMILNSALIEVAKFINDIVEKLYAALMEPLEQLRNAIENAIDNWLQRTAGDIIDALEWIVGVNFSKQTFGFSYMGFTLLVSLNLASLTKSTKTLATMTMSMTISDVEVSGSITVKEKVTEKSKEYLISGTAYIAGDGWDVKAVIDPMMRSSNHMIALSGEVKGVMFDIIMPDVVSYNEIDISLQDIPGLGTILSNIPLGGVKLSFDLGLNLKYTAPFKNGLMINEFESNPEGTDAGNEWVELYNASSESYDLTGYAIQSGSNKSHALTITGTSIGPGGRVVIDLPGSFLYNTGSGTSKNGERVVLFDPDGNEVDKTAAKKDTANNSKTWQRVADGSTEWVFEEGTPGEKNCGGLITGVMVRTQIINIIKESATDTMSDMGNLTSVDDLSKFFQIATQNAIDSAIDMLSDCLVEASIYVSLEVTDPASAGCVGFEASLLVDSNFVNEGLKCLTGEVEDLLLNIGNPYGLDPKEVIFNNTYLCVKVYTGMNTPKFLGDSSMYPEIQMCVDIRANMASISRIVGGDTGDWKVSAGVLISDCPCALIPSTLGGDKTMHNDLWLVKATFKEA